MTRRAFLLFSLALIVPLLVTPADAQTAIGGTQETIYRLTPASTYQDGCFDPCACPVQLRGGLIGAFKMTPAPPDPLYRIFQISDLNLFVPEYGTWVTGTGTYKVGGEFALTQELSLDLKVADRDVQHQHEVVLPQRCVIGSKSSQLDALTPLRTRIHQGGVWLQTIHLAILAQVVKAHPPGAPNVEDMSS